jgi:hypothetical protein
VSCSRAFLAEAEPRPVESLKLYLYTRNPSA